MTFNAASRLRSLEDRSVALGSSRCELPGMHSVPKSAVLPYASGVGGLSRRLLIDTYIYVHAHDVFTHMHVLVCRNICTHVYMCVAAHVYVKNSSLPADQRPPPAAKPRTSSPDFGRCGGAEGCRVFHMTFVYVYTCMYIHMHLDI